jgi:hypothetical protein
MVGVGLGHSGESNAVAVLFGLHLTVIATLNAGLWWLVRAGPELHHRGDTMRRWASFIAMRLISWIDQRIKKDASVWFSHQRRLAQQPYGSRNVVFLNLPTRAPSVSSTTVAIFS